MILFALPYHSQVSVDSLETLADGTIIIKVGGKTYRGIQAPQMREILKDRENLKITQAQLEETIKMFNDYKLLISNKLKAIDEDHAIEIKAEVTQKTFWQTEYDKEKQLRLKYENIVDGCSGKIIFFRVCI